MSTPNPTHIDVLTAHQVKAMWQEGSGLRTTCICGWQGLGIDHAVHQVSVLTDAGYSIVKLPESHPPSDLFQDWWTDDGGWTVERHVGSPQIRLTFDEDDAMETSPDGEFYPFARLTANEAHDLGVALIASAAAAEGEK